MAGTKHLDVGTHHNLVGSVVKSACLSSKASV